MLLCAYAHAVMGREVYIVEFCTSHKCSVSVSLECSVNPTLVMVVCMQACHPGIASTDIYNKMDTSGKLTAKVLAHCSSPVAAHASKAMERGGVLAGQHLIPLPQCHNFLQVATLCETQCISHKLL